MFYNFKQVDFGLLSMLYLQFLFPRSFLFLLFICSSFSFFFLPVLLSFLNYLFHFFSSPRVFDFSEVIWLSSFLTFSLSFLLCFFIIPFLSFRYSLFSFFFLSFFFVILFFDSYLFSFFLSVCLSLNKVWFARAQIIVSYYGWHPDHAGYSSVSRVPSIPYVALVHVTNKY